MKCVLDASAFINADIFQGEGECYTTERVVDELRDFRSKEIASSAMAARTLRISRPSTGSINVVSEKEVEVGCNPRLSETDRGLIALAIDLDATLITDDFRMQNVAAHLGVAYRGVLRGEIKEKRTFKRLPSL